MDRNNKIIIVITIICFLLVASVGLNIYQHQQNKKLSQVTNSRPSAGDDSSDNGISVKDSSFQGKGYQFSDKTGIKTGNVNIDELTNQLNEAEEELDYVWKQLSDAQTESTGSYELQADRYLRDAIDDEYDYLFRDLDLTSEELERFRDILFDNRIAIRDFYRELYGATPSEERRAELKQLRRKINDEEERKITESLGNGVYAKYKAYKDAFDEINEVKSFAASLGSDNMLTETQEKALIETMQKEPIYSETDSDDAKILFPAEIYTENNITEILNMHKSYNEAFIKAAQGILSPSQLFLLKGYLNKEHDNYEDGLKGMIRSYSRQSIENSDDDKIK